MKKRIGSLYNKPIIQGNKNEQTKHELLLTKEKEAYVLSEYMSEEKKEFQINDIPICTVYPNNLTVKESNLVYIMDVGNLHSKNQMSINSLNIIGVKSIEDYWFRIPLLIPTYIKNIDYDGEYSSILTFNDYTNKDGEFYSNKKLAWIISTKNDKFTYTFLGENLNKYSSRIRVWGIQDYEEYKDFPNVISIEDLSNMVEGKTFMRNKPLLYVIGPDYMCYKITKDFFELGFMQIKQYSTKVSDTEIEYNIFDISNGFNLIFKRRSDTDWSVPY